MAHNFGHSFVSLMNYVGNDHIVNEIHSILPHLQEPLRINFLDGTHYAAERSVRQVCCISPDVSIIVCETCTQSWC